MTASIDRQLRSYTEFFEQELPTLDLEDVLATVSDTTPIQLLPPEKPRKRPKWLIAAAAAAAVIVFGGLLVVFSQPRVREAPLAEPPAPSTTAPVSRQVVDPIGVVEALYAAWNAGDVETFMALHAEGAVVKPLPGEPPLSQQAVRDAFLFQYLIGAEWVITDCEAPPATAYEGQVVFCQLMVNTNINRAFGTEDRPQQAQFVIDDGIITENTYPPAFFSTPHSQAADALAQWLAENYDAERIEACGRDPFPDWATPRCAEFLNLHLDEWKASREAQGSS
ncbi:MAG: nuclear transport factor 2 family protein [Acidimicrobiia bacterium]